MLFIPHHHLTELMENSTGLQQDNIVYGSFIERFGAYVIDIIILGLVQGFIIIPILAFMGIKVAFNPDPTDEEIFAFLGSIFSIGFTVYPIIFIIGWLYFALLQCGPRQATIGKMAMGMIVTDVDGARLSFAKASLRYFGKYLSSAVMMIGYIIAAFTEKRQALHDFIANTVVIKK